MSYKLPPVGTVLLAQPNTEFPNPGPTMQIEQMQEWLQADMQRIAYEDNQALARTYRNQFWGNWYLNYWSGNIDNGNPDAPPLAPPAAFVILFTGLAFDEQPSGQAETGPYIPVCEVPKYTKRPPMPKNAGTFTPSR